MWLCAKKFYISTYFLGEDNVKRSYNQHCLYTKYMLETNTFSWTRQYKWKCANKMSSWHAFTLLSTILCLKLDPDTMKIKKKKIKIIITTNGTKTQSQYAVLCDSPSAKRTKRNKRTNKQTNQVTFKRHINMNTFFFCCVYNANNYDDRWPYAVNWCN